MNGWPRIGVVLTVLWIIGFPCYLVTGTNSRAASEYTDCMVRAGKSYASHAQQNPAAPQTLKNMQEGCAGMRDASTVSFAGLFLNDGPHSWSSVLWAITLIPIAILWVVGSIMIVTLRWILRGFRDQPIRQAAGVAGPKKKPRTGNAGA